MVPLISLFACLAFATLAALVLPLLRQPRPARDRGHFDRVVYRDQLQELDRDLARGVLTEAEAASARLEIQRRLLASDTAPEQTAAARNRRSPVLAAIVVLFAAGGAVALYVRMGAPNLPDAPFAARPATVNQAPAASPDSAAQPELAQMLGKLGEKLKANPSDADGWLLYARTAGSLRRWDEAADAYRRAIALGRTGPDIQAGYGESLVLQADGVVIPAARDAFIAALKDDPAQDAAQYYLAIAAAQAGEPRKAIDLFQGLLAGIPEDSPMREEIGKRIGEAATAAGLPMPPLVKGAPPEARNPGAAGTQEGDQKAMIASMVARLAARLEAEPNDPDGWMRLGRAYVAMNQPDQAAGAYDKAAALKPGDATIRLQAAASMLSGLKPEDPLPPRAVDLLRQVEAITPGEPAALWYLGVAAARASHPAEAKQYWTRLLAKIPAGGEDAKMVRAAIDSLKGG